MTDQVMNHAATEEKLRLAILEGAEIWSSKNGLSLHGDEALIRFFADKYHWLPHQVESLSLDHLHTLTRGTELDPSVRKAKEEQLLKDLSRDLGLE